MLRALYEATSTVSNLRAVYTLGRDKEGPSLLPSRLTPVGDAPDHPLRLLLLLLLLT
ncbi:unnamed protein product, partial [Pleuronectes platessa]